MDTLLNLVLLINGAFLAASMFFNAKDANECDKSVEYRKYKYIVAILGWVFMMFALIRFYNVVKIDILWASAIATIISLATVIIVMINLKCFQSLMAIETSIVFGILLMFTIYKYYSTRSIKPAIYNRAPRAMR